MFKKFIVLGSLYWLTTALIAQNMPYPLTKEKNLHQFNVNQWTTKNDLPTNSVLHLTQSNNGYIWITGYAGLIRFDGNRFVVFNKQNSPELNANITGRIQEDNEGRLWITTQESGLITFKNGKLESIGKQDGIVNTFRALYIDGQNHVWSASPEKGWFYYSNEQFHFLIWKKPLKDIEVRDIESGNNHEIYFGTLGHGLFLYKNNELTQVETNQEDSPKWIYDIYRSKNHKLYIGSSQGFFTFDGQKFHKIPLHSNTNINAISEDNQGDLWLGTNNGLIRYNTQSNSSDYIGASHGLTNSFVNDLTFDHEGNLWLTNYKGGLTQIKNGRFINYTSESGLNGKVVNTICELAPQTYLVGFDNSLLNLVKNGEIEAYTTRNNLSGSRIRHILKDSQANIWISTYNGLLKIDKNKKETYYHPNTGFPSSKIRLTYEDSQGNIWIGTRNHGLLKMDKKGFIKKFDPTVGFNSLLIMSIHEYDNKIYVGTNDGGIIIIANDSIKKYVDISNGLPSNIVFNTYRDSDKNIWIAMNGGLVVLQEDNVHVFNTRNGLTDDSPFDVVEDDNGYLWLPSATGIMKINRQELLNEIKKPSQKGIQCTHYNQNDGMITEECNPTSLVLLASDGSLLFPTILGIAEINPNETQINTIKPNVIIESLLVNNQPYDLTKKIVIPPGKKRLTFEYTALSLHEPKKNKFKYQLVGYEDNWIDAADNRKISFTNLAPGFYTFKVIASNNNDIWNEKGDSLSFTIKPRFVQTKTFYILIVITFLLLIYVTYLVRIRQFKYRQRALEAKVKRRTIEISLKNKALEEQKQEIQSQAEKLQDQKEALEKLNTDKDKMFSIIAHDLRSPMGNFKAMLQKLAEAPELYDNNHRQRLLLVLNETAKNTYDLLENLLNWSKTQMGVISYEPEIIEISPILEDIIKLTQPIANKKQINILIKFENKLSAFADNNMVRTIFRNLIMNAVKFTNECGLIEITGKTTKDKAEFCIKDNGIGLSPELQKNLFENKYLFSSLGTHNEKGSGLGLLLCKEFVDINGGKIWVESTLGKGSAFYFTLPLIPEL